MTRPIWLSVLAMTMATGIGCASTSASLGWLRPPADQAGEPIERLYDPHVMLKRAEAFFDRREYAEAASEYERFLDLHRAHVLAPYARFKLAESYFQRFDDIDRDPSMIHQALEQYERVLREHPGGAYEIEARIRRRECRERLAKIHFMVGEFYRRREIWTAAASRYRIVVEEFLDTATAADAQYALASVYHVMGLDDWAKSQLLALLSRHPDSAKARALLARLP